MITDLSLDPISIETHLLISKQLARLDPFLLRRYKPMFRKFMATHLIFHATCI